MLILDIETVPETSDKGFTEFHVASSVPSNYKDPEKIEAKKKEAIREKFSFSPLTGQVACIGLLSTVQSDYCNKEYSVTKPEFLKTEEETNSQNLMKVYANVIINQGERSMIVSALQAIEWYMDNGHRLVTFNGDTFDLPFLFRRAMVNKITKPIRIPSLPELTNRYRHEKHLDLREVLSVDRSDKGRLEDWAYLFGATNELVSDADKVFTWFLTEDFDSLADYNLADLMKTFYVYYHVKDWMGESSYE